MEKVEKIKRHIEVLKKSYDNIVLVMDDDLEMSTDEDGNMSVALKDDKIKIFAEGVKKCAETLDFLFNEITSKEKELQLIIDEENEEEVKIEVLQRRKHGDHLKGN